MRFSPEGFVWIPFTHWILDSDTNGQWHIVTEPCGEMLFIMSRTQSISSDLYDTIIYRIKALGFGESLEQNWVKGCAQADM